MRSSCELLQCTGLILALTAGAAAAPPSFIPLGYLPGGAPESWAGGVSDDGSIVAGTAAITLGDISEAFLWQSGSMTGLGFPPTSYPYPFSGVQAVSADGSILAGSFSSDDGTNEPLRWQGGVFTPLGRIPGYGDNAHFTTGMSSAGDRIVGWGIDQVGVWNQAWLWDNGTMIGLGALPGAGVVKSEAWGISGDGRVVLGCSTAPGGDQAFRWIDGTMTGLGFLPSPFPGPDVSFASVANSASSDGSIIVGAASAEDYAAGQIRNEAFRWSDGVMTGLGDLPGGDFNSNAIAVSADGSVIVGTGTTAAGIEAFVWDSAHGMRALREVLVGDGLDLTGWTLRYVTDISADGTVIVGTGINPDGNYEAFRAVIPEPSTFLVLGTGMLLLAARRQQRQVVFSSPDTNRRGRGGRRG